MTCSAEREILRTMKMTMDIYHFILRVDYLLGPGSQVSDISLLNNIVIQITTCAPMKYKL